MGGKHTPCVGFGLGLERLILLMESLNLPFGEVPTLDVFVMSQSSTYVKDCLRLVRELRDLGVSADTEYTGKSLKAQFKFADKIGAKYAVIIGENEVACNKASVKRLSDGHIEETELSKLAEYFAAKK